MVECWFGGAVGVGFFVLFVDFFSSLTVSGDGLVAQHRIKVKQF